METHTTRFHEFNMEYQMTIQIHKGHYKH